MEKDIKTKFQLYTNQRASKIKIKFLSDEAIIAWGSRILPDGTIVGEITFPGTINYKTKKPVPGGLLCETVFGPRAANACACGELTRVLQRRRINGPEPGKWVCPICQVQWGDPLIRRYQIGYIRLVSTVIHPWILYGTPNYLSLLLEIKRSDLQEIAWCNKEILVPISGKSQSRLVYSQGYKPTLPKSKISKSEEQILIPIGLSESENKKEIIRSLSMLDTVLNLSHKTSNIKGEKSKRIYSKNKNYSQSINPINDNFYGNNIGTSIVPITGGKAIRNLLNQICLESEEVILKQKIRGIYKELRQYGSPGFFETQQIFSKESEKFPPLEKLFQNLQINVRRLRLIQHLTYQIKDLDLFTISILPVLPPVLRPVLELPNGAIAISDLNTLYRHLLVRNRLTTKHQTDTNGTLDLSAFLIQEAVDRLFDNNKAPRPKYPPGDISPWAKNIKTPNPPLKSLTDGLKGKQGRFRQHLLGKRIDYSGRSVITSGPNLKLNQCGIPLEIAIELFQPWLLSYICGGSSNRQIKLVGSFRQAKYLLYNSPTIIWHLLEFFLNEQVVLLNRAPTLHRFGIQAFEPVLVPGRAITLHPLVCPAFNADFDGDQMAVHVPLSLETYSEARIILLAAQNFLTPSTGSPIISLSQDMVLGCYYLTSNPQIVIENYKVSNKIYSETSSFFFSIEEVTILYHRNQISLHSSIWLRWKNAFISWDSKNSPIEVRIGFNGSRVEIYDECQRYYDCWGNLVDQYIKTTAGRAILNQATLPLLPLYRQH